MHATRNLPVYVLTLSLLAAFTATVPSSARAQTAERCFSETGYCISGPIREFWEQNGGLAVFGLPLGPQQEIAGEGGTPIQAQWFERHRLELHPENPAPYNVLLGRLGVDRLAQQGRNWQDFPRLDPNNADAERCRYFRETDHQVCDQFLEAFRSYGLSFANAPGVSDAESLALFGLPISEPISETINGVDYTVQWFERARFELHPENQPPFVVLFGLLGAELQGAGGGSGGDAGAALQRGSWQLESYGPLDGPTLAASGRPATIAFEADSISGNTGCNSFGGPYQATADTIIFGELFSTLVACTSDELNNQERAIFSALQGTVPYTISNDLLLISYDAGRQALIYRAVQAGVVSGTVTYLQRSALPPQALIEVQLVDVSRADAPATVVASTTIEAAGRQVPFPFELAYDPAQIEERNTYAVQARITVDGQLRFISTTRYEVITQGRPTTVEVIVEPV